MKQTRRWLAFGLLMGFALMTAGCVLGPGQADEPPFVLADPSASSGEPPRCDQTPRSPISFAGLEWEAAAGQSAGQTCWSAGEQNVEVVDGHLFLRFQQLNGIWHGAQITTINTVQRGIHCFRLMGGVGDLDPNLRVRLALAGSDGHQVAVELSRQGDPAAIDNALYVIRSPDRDIYHRPVQIDSEGVVGTTHCIDWQNDSVGFWSLVQQQDGMLTEQLKDGVYVTPGTDDLSLRIELLPVDGQTQPLDGSPAEVVIADVTYTETCPVPGSLALKAPAHGTFTTSNQPLLQWGPAPDADAYLVEGFTEASEPVFRGMTADLEYVPPELLDGSYVWRVQGFATANGCYMNSPMSAAFQVTVDTHEPTFSNPVSTDNPAAGGLFSMTLEITDPGSGVQVDPNGPQFFYRFGEGEINERQNDGVVVGSWNGAAYEASFTLDPSYNGEAIYWQVKARDNAGNVGWSEVFGGGVVD